METEIRRAVLADSDQIFSLVRDFATSFDPSRQEFNRSLSVLLGDDSVQLIVAASQKDVVGYCLSFDHYAFYANGRVTWVEEVMVRVDLRGNGIGRKLMSSVEQWAASRDSRLVGLATRRAAPFYSSIGYEDSAIFFRKMMGTPPSRPSVSLD